MSCVAHRLSLFQMTVGSGGIFFLGMGALTCGLLTIYSQMRSGEIIAASFGVGVVSSVFGCGFGALCYWLLDKLCDGLHRCFQWCQKRQRREDLSEQLPLYQPVWVPQAHQPA